jgi:AraC family ethanolamine operon transcriptional activator
MAWEATLRPTSARAEPAPAGLGAPGASPPQDTPAAGLPAWRRPEAFAALLQASARRADAAPLPGPRSIALAQSAERLIWQSVAADEARRTSVRHLAEVLGYSPRALQLAFAQHIGIGVAGYVRLVQLHHTREALRHGASDTVSAVATRYGLWHFGRFSVQYRRAFGESPSVTLRRARSPRAFAAL